MLASFASPPQAYLTKATFDMQRVSQRAQRVIGSTYALHLLALLTSQRPSLSPAAPPVLLRPPTCWFRARLSLYVFICCIHTRFSITRPHIVPISHAHGVLWAR